MNVLLIRPPHPYVHATSFGERTFPIGMGFLISYLRENGHQVYFIDNYLSPQEIESDFLKRHSIDLVGVYVCSITFPQAVRILNKIQVRREKRIWNGRIVVGGPHTSIAPASLPEYVDHVVIGEGERALLDILEMRCQDRIVRYPRIEDLDELPFPAYDVLLKMPYNTRFAMMDAYVMANVNTSRGCPYKCRFCSVERIWGRQYTCFSAERVVDDVERLSLFSAL